MLYYHCHWFIRQLIYVVIENHDVMVFTSWILININRWQCLLLAKVTSFLWMAPYWNRVRDRGQLRDPWESRLWSVSEKYHLFFCLVNGWLSHGSRWYSRRCLLGTTRHTAHKQCVVCAVLTRENVKSGIIHAMHKYKLRWCIGH